MRPPFVLGLLLAVSACTSAQPTTPRPPAPSPSPTGEGGTGGSASPGGNSSIGVRDDASPPSAGAPADAAAPASLDAAAAPADAAVTASDAPAPAAGCAGKFCDDFEGRATGGPPGGDWMVHLEKGMLAVDDKKAFSGERSVRFTHPGAPAAMFIELRKPLLPLPGNVVYGRLMYFLTKSPTGTFSHFEIVRGGGPLPGKTERAQLNTGAENGKVFLNYEPGDCSKPSKAVAFPEKQWACYQWRFDGNKNDIHLWIDGKSVDDAPMTVEGGGCWKHPTAVDTLHIGWESYHGTMPVELWIDDVAVGDQPIPCPTGTPSRP